MPSTQPAEAPSTLSTESTGGAQDLTSTVEGVRGQHTAPRSLDERIAIAKARRDELRKGKELQLIMEQVHHLEQLVMPFADPIIVDGVLNKEGASHAGRKRAASESHVGPQAKSLMVPKDSEKYLGKSIKEHRNFMRACETAFKLAPVTFPTEADKVSWATQHIADELRESWYAHWERQTDEPPYIWESFKGHLLDLVADPIERLLDAATKYSEARQWQGQSIQAFAAYLDTLEDQLTPYSDKHRVQHLYSKLRPKLKAAITIHRMVPETRDELITLGAALEQNMVKSKRSHVGRTRSNGKSQPIPKTRGHRKSRSKNRDNASETFAAASRSTIVVECFKCLKKGHHANKCTVSTKANTQPPGRVDRVGKLRVSW